MVKKRFRSGLIAISATLLLAGGHCWAADPIDSVQIGKPRPCSGRNCKQVPEIDVGAGGTALALLVSALLLAAEKRRRVS